MACRCIGVRNVDAKRQAVLLSLVLTVGANFAHASPIMDLSTGVTDSGAFIPQGQADDDWMAVSTPTNPSLNTLATVLSGSRGSWVTSPSAQWIAFSDSAQFDAPHGAYKFAVAFPLSKQPGVTYSIVGEYSADNRVLDVFLNGTLVFEGPYKSGDPTVCPSINGCEEFLAFTPLRIQQSDVFVDGQNLLTFVVNNDPPTDTNVSGLIVRASVEATTVVPLPAPLWLLGAGFLSYLGLGWSRRAA